MAEQQQTRPVVVPLALGQLIAVNAEFEVLLCVNPKCHKAVSPAGIVEHLRKIHKEKPGMRRQVREFIAEIPWEYDYSSVPLPVDGLAPQPIIQVVDGFQCWDCTFKTQDHAMLGSMQIGPTTRNGSRMKKCSSPLGCSRGSRMGRSGIGSLMRASKLPKSARPIELTLVSPTIAVYGFFLYGMWPVHTTSHTVRTRGIWIAKKS